MEDSSEKSERGRPSIYGPGFKSWLQNNFGRLGHRAQQNMYYAFQAWNWIKDDPACSWLIEGGPSEWKRKTLLMELGRFPDQESAMEAAVLVSKQQPRVRDGALWLRRLRLALAGKEPRMAATVEDVAARLISAIDQCIQQYPQTDWTTVLQAIEAVVASIKEEEVRRAG
jgi:hypothetical protein